MTQNRRHVRFIEPYYTKALSAHGERRVPAMYCSQLDDRRGCRAQSQSIRRDARLVETYHRARAEGARHLNGQWRCNRRLLRRLARAAEAVARRPLARSLPWECRAAQSRQAHTEKEQSPSEKARAPSGGSAQTALGPCCATRRGAREISVCVYSSQSASAGPSGRRMAGSPLAAHGTW